MDNSRQLKIGSFLSYLQMGLSILIGLAYTPVMIRLLGKSEYGLYNTVVSTISTLSILNLGFNSGYIRYYARYKAERNQNAIFRLNGLFLLIFSVIGLVALLCGLFLTNNLPLVFSDGLTEEEYRIAEILMYLMTFNLAFSFPMSVFQNIISAHERFVFLKALGLLKTVVSPLVTLPLLLMGFRSIAMVTVTVVIALVTDCLYMFYTFVKLHNRFVFKNLEKKIFTGLFAYSALIAVNSIVDQINWNVDKILLGRFCGTESVAIYSVGYSLYAYYMTFSTSISGVFTPRIHGIVVECSGNSDLLRERLTSLFVRVGRIQFLLLGLLASGFVFFGKSFIMNIWVGSEYAEAYYVALLLMLPATISLTQNLGIEIQRAQNKHWFRSVAYGIMALVNLGISIVLCQLYGAVGSAIGTAISLVLCNGLVMNLYYHRHCNIDVGAFWYNILMQTRGMLIPIAAGILITHFVEITSVWKFALCVVVYCGIYTGSIWCFSMNEAEKNLLRTPWKKARNKLLRSGKHS